MPVVTGMNSTELTKTNSSKIVDGCSWNFPSSCHTEHTSVMKLSLNRKRLPYYFLPFARRCKQNWTVLTRPMLNRQLKLWRKQNLCREQGKQMMTWTWSIKDKTGNGWTDKRIKDIFLVLTSPSKYLRYVYRAKKRAFVLSVFLLVINVYKSTNTVVSHNFGDNALPDMWDLAPSCQ